jgi:threonine synthase
LLVRYDLDAIRRATDRADLSARADTMWKYRELLPMKDAANVVTLGETFTPLVDIPVTADRVGATHGLVKDEGRLPTGSFKARGLAVAVTVARELGLRRLAMPTNGNAGAALAAYGARAGMETFVLCPSDTPDVNVREIQLAGAQVWRVDALIDACGALVREGAQVCGWFDLSTLREPYRLEGKKTMGLELAEQLDWDLPDVIFYPTGGGTGLIGMWKAFSELHVLGWIGPHRPRMVAVQSTGCAPVVRAFERGADRVEAWEDARTVAAGIRVPQTVGDRLILQAIRESGGFAIAVSDDDILAARLRVARDDGLLLSPEGAATVAAWERALHRGLVRPADRAILFNCGNGLKYPMPSAQARLTTPVDWAAVCAEAAACR